MPPRRKRKSRTHAPTVIFFTQAKNEKGKKQLCVYAECTYGGGRFGPIWSHSANAVTRCLTELSKKCECGRPFHKFRYSEGTRVMTKASAK